MVYSHALNPLNVSEGGYDLHSAWGTAFQAAARNGSLHRTVLVALYKPHDNLMWPARDGVQRNPRTMYTGIVPRYSSGFAGPVVLGPADNGLYK